VNSNTKKLKYPGEPETFSFVLSKLGGLVYMSFEVFTAVQL